MHAHPWMLTVAMLLPACHCERVAQLDTDDEGTGWGASDAITGSSSSTGEESTGVPFDATRWIGRYHYQIPLLPFGEWGDPMGSPMLANFEIFADSTATMLYDHCAFDQPESIAYEWRPGEEPGWLELRPGAGESSLRLMALEGLETARVHLIEPCRELEFEADGSVLPWFSFYPGESCWVDRCTSGNELQVDYCEGEEPPPCP